MIPSLAQTPAAAVKNLCLTLGAGATKVEIFQNLDLEFQKGRTTAIVGPSGCGKSSLLMILAGLERATAGEASIGGARIDQMSEDALAAFRANHIGVVFQSFHLMPTLTALENVALPLELNKGFDAFARAGAELERLGLGGRINHYPAQLSGGEQQRVALARALAGGGDLILADEPTGNLDEATGAAVIDLMFSEIRRRNATLILVTHDAALAKRCDVQVFLRAGKTEKILAPEEQS